MEQGVKTQQHCYHIEATWKYKEKKPVSPLILKDMLSADADALENHIAKKHDRIKKADCRIVNDICRSVEYFSQLFLNTKE